MENQVQQIEHLIEHGRYLEARAQTQLVTSDGGDLRLQQLHALAVSKSGMPAQAMDFLEKVYGKHSEDAETAGILGGIYKELFKKTEDSEYAIKSRDTYLKNFSLSGSYYTGINAATMSAIAGQARKGREIAEKVISAIGETSEFWAEATLGEAYLLTKDYKKSIDFYLKARQRAGTDWGKISSVFNQLWLISHYMNVPSEILKIFNPPAVAAFVGHMIDRADRPSPRFPATIENEVKAAIRSSIRSNKIAIGYCSLACGGDILFAEAMEEEGGELNIFIPFRKEDFIRESVSFAGENWTARFERLMQQHPVSYVTHESYDHHTDLFSMQSKVVLGSTLFRRSLTHSDAFLISVLSDFDFTRMEGGTRDNISLWPFRDKLINISPNNYLVNAGASARESTLTNRPMPSTVRPALYTLVIDSKKDNSALLEKIIGAFEGAVVPPLASCIDKGKLVAGFSALRPLWDFIHLLKKTKGVIADQLRLSINGGPIELDDHHEKDTVQYKVMKGAHLEAALYAHQFCESGACIALSPIAYELALYKVAMEPLSRVTLANGEVAEVFTVLG